MQILTVSIDGVTRTDLAAALGEVLALVQGGIDQSQFENEQQSYRFAIKTYENRPFEPGAVELNPNDFR